jgi:hypothetical protein
MRPFDAKVAVRKLGVKYANDWHCLTGGLGDPVVRSTRRQEQRNQFIKAMRAEGVSIEPMRGCAILPVTMG